MVMFVHENKDDVIKELKDTFQTKQTIEEVFKKYHIEDINQKLEALKACNTATQSFHTPNYEDLTPEDKYYFEVEIFKYKIWEEVELYKRHGL